MDFDENEAFLAIVNIAAFAKMAISQIGSAIAYEEAAEKSEETKVQAEPTLSLVHVAGIGTKVLLSDPPASLIAKDKLIPEGQVASSVAGFLSGSGRMKAEAEYLISESPRYYADLHLDRSGERCVVEFKREVQNSFPVDRSLDNLERYMQAGQYTQGMIVAYSGAAEPYGIARFESNEGHTRLLVAPKRMLENKRFSTLQRRIVEILR